MSASTFDDLRKGLDDYYAVDRTPLSWDASPHSIPHKVWLLSS